MRKRTNPLRKLMTLIPGLGLIASGVIVATQQFNHANAHTTKLPLEIVRVSDPILSGSAKIIAEPSITGLNIIAPIQFEQVGDSVEMTVLVKNNSNKTISMANLQPELKNSFIQYNFTNDLDGTSLEPGKAVEFKAVATYIGEIDPVMADFRGMAFGGEYSTDIKFEIPLEAADPGDAGDDGDEDGKTPADEPAKQPAAGTAKDEQPAKDENKKQDDSKKDAVENPKTGDSVIALGLILLGSTLVIVSLSSRKKAIRLGVIALSLTAISLNMPTTANAATTQSYTFNFRYDAYIYVESADTSLTQCGPDNLALWDYENEGNDKVILKHYNGSAQTQSDSSMLFVCNHYIDSDGKAREVILANDGQLGIFENMANISIVSFTDGINTSRLTSAKAMFKNSKDIMGIQGFRNLDFSHVTNMDEMFEGSDIQYINLSDIQNTSSVVSMKRAFANTANLESVMVRGGSNGALSQFASGVDITDAFANSNINDFTVASFGGI